MAYSNRYVKGRVGLMKGTGWPLVIIERAKSDNPMTRVLCEVWGFEHESGSVYLKDISLTGIDSVDQWLQIFENRPYHITSDTKMYFKGKLTAEDMPPKPGKAS